MCDCDKLDRLVQIVRHVNLEAVRLPRALDVSPLLCFRSLEHAIGLILVIGTSW